MEILNGGGWLKPALLSMLFWGLWGFFTKVGADKVPWQTALIYYGICMIVIGLIGGPTFKGFNGHHFSAIIAGITVSLGYLFFYLAISKGSASTVIPVTALYVAVAAILAFIFLSEPVTLKTILGIGCAVAAMILFV